MRRRALIALAFVSVGLPGCGIFGGGKDNIEPPAELVDFDSRIDVRRVWSRKVGGGTERLRLGLAPATDGSRIYAGSHNGDAAAIDIETGRVVWSVDTQLPLAAGPAIGGNLLVFGTSSGELIALEAESGAERWRTPVGSEVLASPAIGGNVVVYRSVDGRLRGCSTTTGNPLWTVEQTMPALTLRGNTAPRVAGAVAVSGFDNGRVGAYDLVTGQTRWEMAIANPTGRNDLERLVDVNGGLQVVGNDVYVASYHGRAVGIDLVTGLVIWQRELSSFAGLGVDNSFVYVSDDVGTVMALDRSGGAVVWRQEALRLRDLTAPTRYRQALVVGDFEGYLHWLDPGNGEFLDRVRAASAQISAPPIVVGSRLFVQADDGTVAAFEIVDESV